MGDVRAVASETDAGAEAALAAAAALREQAVSLKSNVGDPADHSRGGLTATRRVEGRGVCGEAGCELEEA